MTQEYINNLLRVGIMEEVNKRIGKDFENVNDLIEYAKNLEKENELLIIENEEMKKGLGCDTCQIHLEYANLNSKIRELESKENRVIWHDLKKNPNDLPQKIGDYIVAIKFKYLKGCDTTILRYDEDEDKLSWIDSEYTNCNDDVIAWCEIPKFRVESK